MIDTFTVWGTLVYLLVIKNHRIGKRVLLLRNIIIRLIHTYVMDKRRITRANCEFFFLL